MKYCEFCGKELNDDERCLCPEAQQKNAKSAKLRKLALCIAAPLAAVALIIILLLGSIKTDPFDFISVSFKGYNSNGSAVVHADVDAMVAEIVGEEPDGEDMEKRLAWIELYDAHVGNIKVECAPTEELCNGDEVTVTVTVSGDTAKKVKGSSKTYKVEGLTEIELVDVFAEVDVVFEGVNGSGIAKVVREQDKDEFIDSLRFSIDEITENGTLSNGDEVVIVVTCYDYDVEHFGKAPKEKRKTFKASGLSEYVTVDTLPMDVIRDYANRFVQQTQTKIDDESSSMFSYAPVKLHAMYFAVEKEDAIASHHNQVHIVVCYDEYMKGEYWRTVYLPLVFKDVTLTSDGKLNVEYEDGSGSGTFYTEPEAHREKIEKNYNVTEIE